MAKVPLDPKKATADQIAKGLELLQKEEVRKERIAKGELKGGQKWSELSKDQKAARLLSGRKRNAALVLYKQKAIAAGITVSEAEIDAYMSSI